jgi:hypothetical protein
MRGIGIPLIGGAVEFDTQFSERHIYLKVMYRRDTKPAKALTNRVFDDWGRECGWVMFADLDTYHNVPAVLLKLEAMREALEFGTTYIIESSPHNYHLICPELCSLKKAAMFALLSDSDHSLDVLKKSHELALRVSPKEGVPVRAVGCDVGEKPELVSGPHLRFLHHIYNVDAARLEKHWRGVPRMGTQGEFKYYHYYNK